MLNKENKESPILTYAETLHPDPGDVVVATAVAIDEEVGNETSSSSNTDEPETSSCDRFNFIVIIIGWSFKIASVATTYALEGACALLYMLASGFWHISEMAKDYGLFGLPFRVLFSLLSTIMLLVDALLLYLSTFLTEFFAVLCRLLCTLFGGCSAGNAWHQTIRKECHMKRIAFRSLFKDWTSPRGQPCGKGDSKDTSAQQSDTGAAAGTIVPLPSKKDHTATPPPTNPGYQQDNQDDTIVVAMEDVQIIDDGDTRPETNDISGKKQSV